MFIFGSSENTRDLYLSNALTNIGPNLPSTSFDELDESQQKALFAYVYMAYSDALKDRLSEEDISSILELYDDVFSKMAKAHSSFREAVIQGRHVFLPDYSENTLAKYKGIVSASQEP